MPNVLSCAATWLASWTPLLVVAAILVAVRPLILAPRLRRVGSPAPGVVDLAALLVDGRFRGTVVREERSGPFGGGRYLPGRREIRLAHGMLARGDVDALMILEHERGHAECDLPAPRPYRLALVAVFLVALALGLNGRLPGDLAALAMVVAYSVAVVHYLRNEAMASVYALRATAAWPPGLRREARTRLAAAYGVYLAEWAIVGALTLVLIALVHCGAPGS